MAIVSTELTLLNELAKVAATQCEWLSIAAVVTKHIRDAGFVAQYRRMSAELETCYRFTEAIFARFVAVATFEQFERAFDRLNDEYQQNYLFEASEPRRAADRAYEIFLGILQRKQFKTTYPLLKRTFDRLDYFVDKYVTNDAWLVMSIDAMLKRMSRFLHEVAELRKVDREEAFLVYRALMLSIERFLGTIRYAGAAASIDEASAVLGIA